MNDYIKAILSSGTVWSAFLLLVNTVLFLLWPQFPRELWATINGVIIAILGAVGVNVTRAKVNQVRAARLK